MGAAAGDSGFGGREMAEAGAASGGERVRERRKPAGAGGVAGGYRAGVREERSGPDVQPHAGCGTERFGRTALEGTAGGKGADGKGAGAGAAAVWGVAADGVDREGVGEGVFAGKHRGGEPAAIATV